ncbi:MAG: hypothetical protein E7451_06980 [Ruminococcaceae bacterium]|nr:hypothetical protein [Oscillospiraceae bacterium]
MKKLFAIVLSVLMLAGCTLAKPGASGQDQLTGFFLTVSRKEGDTIVDYWDAEAAGMDFLSDHYMAGQKLYAEKREGDPLEYVFPEGCGLYAFSFDALDGSGEPLYRSSDSSPEIDTRVEYHVGSTTACRINATIYGEKGSNVVIAMNPVYQTPDGELYALSAEPVSVEVGSMEGFKLTQSQEGSDGEGCALELTVEHVVLPETYIIIEMNEENQPLRQSEYAPEAMPEVYTPGADAAYLILEARDGEDTTRTVYSPGDEVAEMDTYYPGEYGLCIKGYTRIEWEGVK